MRSARRDGTVAPIRARQLKVTATSPVVPNLSQARVGDAHRWPEDHGRHPQGLKHSLGREDFGGDFFRPSESHEGVVTKRVIADGVAAVEYGPDQLRVGCGALYDDKKSGRHVVGRQQAQQVRGGGRIGPSSGSGPRPFAAADDRR
jgi:hypothetical protein